MSYKLMFTLPGSMQVVRRLADSADIPFAEDNRDYQEYLEWVAEGDTPEPAESEEE